MRILHKKIPAQISNGVNKLKHRSKSQFRVALSHLKKSRLSRFSIFALFTLYTLALFADFFVPYAYDDEERLL
ncbi:MAG TPA: hypothetical protein ENH41_00590, partial [Candidatus Omnitrophica bacterium]|nr:hypothetical protein [Candidatus Omnitrophota bacterium]